MDSNPYESPVLADDNATDPSRRPSGPFQSLSILIASVLTLGLYPLLIPRFTGGLVGVDFLLMLALPVSAYCAGMHWYHRATFLAYGAIGMMTFFPIYLGDSQLRFRFGDGGSTVARQFAVWAAAVLFAAIICSLAGKAAHSTQTDSETRDASQ